MKNYLFVFNESTPKYKQIYEQFKSLIEQGNVKADEQLPSIRKLAASLQVSRNTTLSAYNQLEAEGYIRGEGRKGYFVNRLEPSLSQEALIPTSKKRVEKKASVRVNFRTDAVDQYHFPLKLWRRIANQVLTLPESFQYGEPFGEVNLREQIA
ncbi:GntR family transcriptional regulator, partial [Virgibacillus sp. W0181]